MLFTIIPYDYMVENGYEQQNLDKVSVENITQSELEDRKYNNYTHASCDIKYNLDYYYNKYQKYILYNVQGAYDKLDEQFRKEKFPTLQDYKNYLVKNIGNIRNSHIVNYSVNNGENYKDYNCEDQFGNKYTFRVTNVNEYTIILNY